MLSAIRRRFWAYPCGLGPQVLPASFFVWNYPQLFGKQRGAALDAGRMQTVLRIISAAATSAKHEKEMSERAREARFRDAYDDKHEEEPVLPRVSLPRASATVAPISTRSAVLPQVLKVGVYVRHSTKGRGIVTEISDDDAKPVCVEFDNGEFGAP